jgi:hypothetical protein
MCKSEASEARRLKELEDENRRLKHMVADLSLDREALKAVIRKKRLELVGLRHLAPSLVFAEVQIRSHCRRGCYSNLLTCLVSRQTDGNWH